MKLSKSKYCNGIQCRKMLWLYKNKPEEAGVPDNDSVLDNGNLVHEIARNLFDEHTLITFNEDLNVMINNTKKELLKENNVICEASFNYQNNFCSVDILVKKGNFFEIYEVKGSTKLKDNFINDLSYQVNILTKLGYHVKKSFVVTLNSNYQRHGDLDLNKLFIINDVSNDVIDRLDSVKKNIQNISEFIEKGHEEDIDIDNYCFKPYRCPFFDYCTKELPKNNVFDVFSMSKKNKINLYKKGICTFSDLLKSDINEYYKQQIRHELNDLNDEIDSKNVKEFLNTLSYPLYFLDFETFQSPIPLYDGTSPYEQIPFQYSLHYIIDGKLHHKEFLAKIGNDPRRELAERLVSDIPKDVCVLAYNMSFEKKAILKLANCFPDLREHLMMIHDNIKDLMIPFKKRYYYNKRMKGSYSIKYVLPALFPCDSTLDYHNLDLIHNGTEAMNSFVKLVDMSKEEQDYTRERLLRYCELDTYAMVKIYEKLLEVKNDINVNK